MECVDSIASMDKTSKNRVSAVGTRKCFKINIKILMKSTNQTLCYIDESIIWDHFPL